MSSGYKNELLEDCRKRAQLFKQQKKKIKDTDVDTKQQEEILNKLGIKKK